MVRRAFFSQKEWSLNTSIRFSKASPFIFFILVLQRRYGKKWNFQKVDRAQKSISFFFFSSIFFWLSWLPCVCEFYFFIACSVSAGGPFDVYFSFLFVYLEIAPNVLVFLTSAELMFLYLAHIKHLERISCPLNTFCDSIRKILVKTGNYLLSLIQEMYVYLQIHTSKRNR